jgi:hypothetical protein
MINTCFEFAVKNNENEAHVRHESITILSSQEAE